jgi:N-acyl amino acid synthase of PEP-CTERM/exosortase system
MYLGAATNTERSTPQRSISRLPLSPPLIEAYRRVFEGLPANTPALLEAAHRLRYQVYCVENRFEDPAENPGGRECDEYDHHSLHAVLLHRTTQTVVGAVRVVLHKPGARSRSLPFHTVCRHPRLCDPDFLPLDFTAEIGRFAISKACRRQLNRGTGSRFCGPKEPAEDLRRLLPHITLGLFKAALQMSIPYRIRHVCAVMEPNLLRLLTRFGIRFEPLGPAVNYHGLRQPCYANIAELLARVEDERREVWEVITDCGRLCVPAKTITRKVAQFAKRDPSEFHAGTGNSAHHPALPAQHTGSVDRADTRTPRGDASTRSVVSAP